MSEDDIYCKLGWTAYWVLEGEKPANKIIFVEDLL